MRWYLAVMRSYSGFDGRAGLSEFWYFTLFHVMLLALAPFADMLLGELIGRIPWAEPTGVPVITMAYLVGSTLPALAVLVRRLHDTGRSGWWGLVNLALVVGNILCAVWLLQPGESGTNSYGEPVQS